MKCMDVRGRPCVVDAAAGAAAGAELGFCPSLVQALIGMLSSWLSRRFFSGWSDSYLSQYDALIYVT